MTEKLSRLKERPLHGAVDAWRSSRVTDRMTRCLRQKTITRCPRQRIEVGLNAIYGGRLMTLVRAKEILRIWLDAVLTSKIEVRGVQWSFFEKQKHFTLQAEVTSKLKRS